MKVIKNRTAYFNQSMMEVSVLDLVCLPRAHVFSSPGISPWRTRWANVSSFFFTFPK